MNITDIKNQLDDLAATASRNQRESRLQGILKDDNELSQTIAFLLNTFIKTNIAKAKINKALNEKTTADATITTYTEFLDYLTNDASGKDSSIKAIQDFIITQDAEVREFLKAIATKSYTANISSSTYNKIAKKLNIPKLPQFKVQTAENIDGLSDKLSETPDLLGDFTVTEKFDGIRCVAFVKTTNGQKSVQLFKRSGKLVEGAIEIETALKALDYDEHVFDGELIISDEKYIELFPDKADDEIKAEDKFKATTKIVNSKDDIDGIEFHIFDELNSVDRFLQNESSRPYGQRRDNLNTLAEQIDDDSVLKIVPSLYSGDDLAKIFEIKDEIISNGGEGVMVNRHDSIYEYKRTKNLLKVKQVNENDGIIKGVYEGNGENEGRLGGIIITYKDTEIKIGSGFTKEERIKYWENPELIIGKVGSYKFTTESENEKGGEDVRFGRWKGLRDDKTTADVSYDN